MLVEKRTIARWLAQTVDGILGLDPNTGGLWVTGTLSTTGPATVSNSAVPGTFASMVAGPTGIRIQNTSATGQPNIRVAAAGEAGPTRGVQLAPGQSEIFAVTNANLLGWDAESGSPTVGVSQA